MNAFKVVSRPLQVDPRAQQQQHVLPSAAANNAKMAPDPVVRKRLIPGMEQGPIMKLADQRAIVAQIRAQEIQKQKKAAAAPAAAAAAAAKAQLHAAGQGLPAKLTLGVVARMGGAAGSEKSYQAGQVRTSADLPSPVLPLSDLDQRLATRGACPT